MPGKLYIIVLLLAVTRCLSQDPRPTFPNVFQTEIEGTFIDGNGVVEIDASMFYDRNKNRAAIFVTKEGDDNRLIYNFDDDEYLSINSNECEVQPIPDRLGFLRYYMIGGKKRLSPAEESFFFFDESEQQSPFLLYDIFPSIQYKAEFIPVKEFGLSNCTLEHVFSIPNTELPSCKEGAYCKSTLIAVKVTCWDENSAIIVEHMYRYSKFIFEIQDESVFFPPPGIHCDMKNKKEMPSFPSYFSFSFDIVEKKLYSQTRSQVFNTHKEIWYDSDFQLIRIDEFDDTGLMLSSRIFELQARIAFLIVATVPTCGVGPIEGVIKLDDVTRLPKSFFAKNSSIANAVYVGKRKVHGLDFDVWSRTWSDADSDARIVEEIYYLEIEPNREKSEGSVERKSYFQISHIDMYTYELNDNSHEYELALLKYFDINNFRTHPKEWAAFDVSTCFHTNQTKVFSMKVKGPPLVKEGQPYRELLQLLYNKIIAATGVSVVRISELGGIFDGVELVEIRGSILDKSEAVGWPKDSIEPGMEETFKLIQDAASENKLSVTFVGDDKKEIRIDVISVDEINGPAPPNTCFSGVSLAAASLVLLLIGIAFGIAGYYVFLKKRKPKIVHIQMTEKN